MAALRTASRRPVGSESWISEERAFALQIVESETEEFSFSARNELDWLNEHMMEIFDENQLNVAEIFKTPGRLRGKTPRTARKRNPLEARTPLSEVFSATPRIPQISFEQNFLERQDPSFHVAEDPPESEIANDVVPKPVFTRAAINDSGYFGSQDVQAVQGTKAIQTSQAPQTTQAIDLDEEMQLADQTVTMQGPMKDQQQMIPASTSKEIPTTENSFQSTKEEQTLALNLDESKVDKGINMRVSTPEFSMQPEKVVDESLTVQQALVEEKLEKVSEQPAYTHEVQDDIQSPSDGSSPIRPIVRKSSLTFASLPAREPLTTKKSFGNRTSRTSQLEQSRTSYYGRYAESKALGEIRQEDRLGVDEMDIDTDDANKSLKEESGVGESKITRLHNKTSTQRLQDQITMLGKSQPNASRPSKSIPNIASIASQSTNPTLTSEMRQPASPVRNDRSMAGAFPDDEDDWIDPQVITATTSTASPRPALSKGITTDVTEGINDKESISGSGFIVPKPRRNYPKPLSPLRKPVMFEGTGGGLTNLKSASTSALGPSVKDVEPAESPHKKGISVSNPSLVSIIENTDVPTTPLKSPSRLLRDSPLKAAKDKVYSILKTSKNLFASSAAVSAAAKGATLPSTPARLGLQSTLSLETVPQQATAESSLYPNLDIIFSKPGDAKSQIQLTGSPGLENIRKTRASAEREGKKKEKEAKEIREAQKMDEKLEKLREKESEKARAFSQQERERIAALEKQLLAKAEQERAAEAVEADAPRATRSSPRKPKIQLETESRLAAAPPPMDDGERDVEMIDAPIPPQHSTAAPRATKSRDQIKRPIKPIKEVVPTRQAPVVIRVDTGSQRNPQRNQFHPSNSTLAASLAESLAPASTLRTVAPQSAQKNKAGGSSLRSKVSVSSIKSASSTTGRLRALEAAAKKKEQADQEAQRKRNIKLENDRKRAALQEEKQQEQRRFQEAAKQREREREHAAAQMESKNIGQQTLEKRMEIENAKQQRPPPPAPRPQLIDLTKAPVHEKALPLAPAHLVEQGQHKPLCMASATNKLQEEFARTISSAHQNTTKVPPKRPLPQEAVEESRTNFHRNGLSNHQHIPDSKRRKTGDNQDDDIIEGHHWGSLAPPIRQSNVRQKDVPTKSVFPNGYANISQPSHTGQSLHKAVLNAQHVHQVKPSHPMDMAQTSKTAIIFAPNPSQAAGHTYKTPARPVGPAATGGKSTSKPSAKSSPRFPNGDSIVLPEIHTDSEDEDSDGGKPNNFPIPGWADSPALRNGLIRQEGIDPASVFGLPGEIKLEEVFKGKDRHARFRARTSSANWNGNDRLTEEEVKKDLEARERLRREGGWSYGLS